MSTTTPTGATALLAELERAGVRLWAEGAGLGYEAPPGVLRPEVLAAMTASKAALLSILSTHDGTQPRHATRPEPQVLAGISEQPAAMAARRAHDRARVLLGRAAPAAEVEELAAALLACDQEEAAWRAAGAPRVHPDAVYVGELYDQEASR